MKIILSRKGFDSENGGMPSPILPDATLLSLPIPSKMDVETKYTDIQYKGMSYYDLIRMLNPKTRIKEYYACHLDPDIRETVRERQPGWMPAFGQEGAALSHLKNQNVGVGDLFLFFGWFKQTLNIDGKIVYDKDAPDLHIIYGYFQVGEIIDNPTDIPAWLEKHPHTKAERWAKPNVIYVAAPHLSFCPELPGAGNFVFGEKSLVLTKPGCSRSTWALPDFFRYIPISYNANAWKEDSFIAASKGQEFVFEANDEAIEWVEGLMKALPPKYEYKEMTKEEVVGVFRMEEGEDQIGYEHRVLTEEEYRDFLSGNPLPGLEATFVISDKEFKGAEEQIWQQKEEPILYVDRVMKGPDASEITDSVLHDFMVINAEERGAKTVRVRIDGDTDLIQDLLDGEYKCISSTSFLEANAENFD